MEKYISTTRLILITDNLSRMSLPLRSRCLCLRNSSPSSDQIEHLLSHVIDKEKIRGIKEDLVKKIAEQSKGNMRRALLILQTIDFQNEATPNDDVFNTDWELGIKKIAQMVVYEQRPKM